MPSSDANPGAGTGPDRRSFLRRGAASAVALGGLGRLSGPAGSTTNARAGGGTAGEDTDARGFPRVTTRGHFAVDWWSGARLTEDHTPTDYETVGSIPGWRDGDSPDELVVAIHGWLVDADEALAYFATVDAALARHDYGEPTIGFSYDSDSDADDWWAATDVAARNGPKLAAFLRDYADGNPGTDLRLIGHSLGARVVLTAIEALEGAGRRDVLASATLLGGAVEADAVSTAGAYGTAIESAVGRFDNFWKSDDDVLNWAFAVGSLEDPVGATGIDGPAPANYADHNVDYVPDHFSYYDPEDGCVDEVVETFRSSLQSVSAA